MGGQSRKPAGGVLDLSDLGATQQKVKLPDKKLYSMANPAALGVLPQQQLISRYGRAKELMGKTDATESDVEEMLELLLDVCQVVLPDAPREVVGQLGLSSMDRLVRVFLAASQEAKDQGEGATGESPTSGS